MKQKVAAERIIFLLRILRSLLEILIGRQSILIHSGTLTTPFKRRNCTSYQTITFLPFTSVRFKWKYVIFSVIRFSLSPSSQINIFLRSSVFWDIAQQLLLVTHRRFGTAYRSLNVANYEPPLRNVPNKQRPHLLIGGILKSRITFFLIEDITMC